MPAKEGNNTIDPSVIPPRRAKKVAFGEKAACSYLCECGGPVLISCPVLRRAESQGLRHRCEKRQVSKTKASIIPRVPTIY